MADRHNTQTPPSCEDLLRMNDMTALRYQREASHLFDLMRMMAIDTAVADLDREMRA